MDRLQLYDNGSLHFPNVPAATYPYLTAPTYRVASSATRATVSVTGNEAVKAFDGVYGTSWAAGEGVTTATLNVNLPAPSAIAGAALNEVGPYPGPGGSRVYGIQSYNLYLSDGTTVYLAASGDHIGPDLVVPFSQTYSGITSAWITVSGIRLLIGEFQLLSSVP